ncbi:MAG: EAL domain-containing protein [Lachnospiraceae bacterium]|nr:EAL domain-containing protein [Lachnospiraceae bacterium]
MDKFGYSLKHKRRILIVDDEEVNRLILQEILGELYETDLAENGRVAYEMLREAPAEYSLVLLDLLMPVMDGFELLQRIRSEGMLSDIPVIVMTSEKPAEVKSINLGADDFFSKPYRSPEVIKARCSRIIQLYENRRILNSTERDSLTGLYNRDFFYEYVSRMDYYKDEPDMDAIVLNIEHFHMLNEMYGRKFGDKVLKRMADILVKTFEGRESIAARPDADYFYLYIAHAKDHESMISGIQEALSDITDIPRIRIRAGIYENADITGHVEEKFDHAKFACDRIRGDYTRNIFFYSRELSDRDLYHERLIHDIDSAIENKDLIVYFQPKYFIQSEEYELRSAEALIRWKHPELGMISPGDFIPLFEKNGLIQKLDHYVWAEAARRIREWKDKYSITVPVSVNVSRVDIYDPELETRLKGILDKNGLDASELMLEITESAYADDADGLAETVEGLRRLGFKIEMDDFGSGYSSLNMITSIPIDVLKMDMEFIRNMNKDEKSLKLVELVIDISDFLDVPVIAEGVEEKAQVDILREMGCEIIQGYYFSKPVPSGEFEAFIRKELCRRAGA